MVLWCKLFGHSFTNMIYSSRWYTGTYSVSQSDHAFCKNCGKVLGKVE